MKSKGHIYLGLVILVSLGLGVLIGKHAFSTHYSEKVTDTIVVKDTLIEHLPSPVKTVFVPIIEHVIDTEYVVQDYQTLKIYRDTLKLDFGKIEIVDSVLNNSLQGQSIITDFNVERIVFNKVKDKSFGIGANIGKLTSNISAHLRLKRCTFEAGYDIRNSAPTVGFKYDMIVW